MVIVCGTFGYYFYAYGGPDYSNFAYVAICLIGGLLGFLRYNFHRAPIFMGDTGSLVCGFIVSVLAIQFIEMGVRVGQPFGSSAPSVAVGILFVPLFDTIRVFSLRMLAGRSPFSPDKNHIHHRILAMGFSQISTVLLLGLLNMLVAMLVIRFAYFGNTILIVALVVFSALLSVFFGVYHSRISRRQLMASENAQ